MNTVTIDTKGIDFLSCTLTSDHITPYLVKNDKTPGYDGYLQLSDGKGCKISNYCGRLDVQVKSHENRGGIRFSETMNFSVKKRYLDFYLNNNGDGLIYFHVYIGESSSNNIIYYSILSRGKLIKYVNDCTTKDSISIPFKQFPCKAISIQKMLKLAYEKILKEKNIDRFKTETMEAAKFKGFSVSSGFVDNPLNMLKSINSGKSIAYTFDGHLISDFDHVKVGFTSDISLRIKDVEFFSGCTIVPKEKETIFYFSDGLNIHLFDNGKYTLNYKSVESLRTEYSILNFMVELFKNKEFSIIDRKTNGLSRFSFPDIRLQCSAQTWEEGLILYSKVLKVIEFLNVSETVIISSLHEQDFIDATLLYDGLLEKKAIKLKNEEPTVLAIIKIGNIHLAFVNIRNNDGRYSVHDIRSFDMRIRTVKVSDDGQILQTVPIESVFNDKRIWTASNLKFDSYLNQLDDIYALEPGITEFANTDLLNLLMHYDETNNQKLLSYADKLSDWVLEHAEKKNDNIYVINRLQTIKRIRLLNDGEKEQLQCIIEDSKSLKERVAACALLERYQKLSSLLKELSEKELNELRSWPIGHFIPWKED